jgi:bifunctional DNA-binding transcriptional regulator/antitoxin component of YhaV-PrlF toxin-antitoxin module
MKVSESKAGQKTCTIPKRICDMLEIRDGDSVDFILRPSIFRCEFRKVKP